MAITPLPTPPSRQDPTNFAARGDAFLGALPTFATEANQLALDVNADAVRAEDEANIAQASAAAAIAIAGASQWVSGQTYAAGEAAWSPIDLFTYRRKTTGSGTTDPSIDTANWALVTLARGGISSVETTTGSASIVLTMNSSGYQAVSMTATGKHVQLPDATTLFLGGPIYVIKNFGSFPFGIRDADGTLLIGLAPGGIAYMTLQSKTTAAGSWSLTGNQTEPALIIAEQTFSTTYSPTLLDPYVQLSEGKSIHFVATAAGGFAAFVVNSNTGEIGTPSSISTTATDVPRAAFRLTETTAIVFFRPTSSAVGYAVVLSVSNSTTLSVGVVASSSAIVQISQEDSVNVPKIARLSSTLLVMGYNISTSTRVVAISISGTTITIGAEATVGTVVSSAVNATTYALTETTAIVFHKTGAAAPFANTGAVITVSGTTCTVGTPVTLSLVSTGNTPPSSCQLSATKFLLVDDNNVAGTVRATPVTISGTTITEGTPLTIESGIGSFGTAITYIGSSATRFNPHLSPLSASTALLWYIVTGYSRAVVLSEASGTITRGDISYDSFSIAATGEGAGRPIPFGTTEFVGLINESATPTFSPTVVPSRINGTTITVGPALKFPEAVQQDASLSIGARLPSGDYLVGFSSSGNTMGASKLKVFRSNGASINDRGYVSIPNLLNGNYPIPTVGTNKIVMFGLVGQGRPSTTTFGLRVISMEIAK